MAKGRPRAFDIEEALDIALKLFWTHGYEGTSVAMLCNAIGINMPSLYSAFGNKEALFKTVLERYIKKHVVYLTNALAEPTARQVASRLLYGAIEMVNTPDNPDGCLVVQAALVSNPVSDAIRVELNRRRGMAEAAIRQRFEYAKETGDLPAHTDTEKLARFIITVNWGNAVQSASGATREQLESVVEMAMRVWPQ